MNNNTSDILSETKEFAEIFKQYFKEEIIPWKDKNYIGISIVKDYPKNILFIPVKNKKEENDSVILIKIGYELKESIESKEKKAVLHVEVHKSSKYIFNHMFINEEDEDAPTENSLKRSNLSPQPYDLEETSRYYFFTDKKKFFDTKIHRYINPKNIVNDIYKAHLKTLTDKYFRMKMSAKDIVVNKIEPITNFLIKINSILFGKQIKKDRDDFATGIFSPYKHTDLVETVTDRISIPNTNLLITYQTARTFFIAITTIFVINHIYKYDLFGLISLFNEANSNALFIVSITSVILFFLDRVLPHLILDLVNLLIILKWRMLVSKVTI